ncbi:MAG: DUF885 family protein [Haliscomenobacter sp.]|uniref:DUF885 family protein n=1 Tax=Haliscomenobacter sp. TaxID=2717303 RepID=UPI0029ACDEDF|nr:DUF885 family protein [Haliscomenobacter sp.]MDX2069917.1 DUF885 family protein [Haliscomenobacter sp.]
MQKTFTFCLLLFLTSLWAQAQNTNPLYLQTSEMANQMVQYDADKGSIMRFYATSNPMEFRGQGSSYNSPERRQRLLSLIAANLKQLEAIDFDKMNINGKVDYLLFKRNLEDEQYQLQAEQKNYDQIVHHLPFSDRVYTLIKSRNRGQSVNGQEVAKAMNDILNEVKQANGKLKAVEPFDQNLANLASEAVKGMQAILKSYYNFYNAYDPLFSWWVPKTYTSLDAELETYAKGLAGKGKSTSTQKDDGSGIVGKPIGREELIRQLKLEFIPYTPDELIDIANKEFAWCDAELLKASQEMGFGNDWKAAQEKVKNSYVAPGQQPEAMLELYDQSVAFLKKYDLVTIPPIAEETWRVNMMSAERQLVSPFFLGGESLIISYPTPTMSYDEKMMSMRGNNPHFSRATVHHELIAGHHLQGFMNNRNKTYRKFGTPFWHEGNALYWEFLLWDMKFPRSPEDRIGMLFWRMHRCARIIFSLKYHLGEWTPQQCINFLVDRVGHERANAEGEVRRSFTGNYGPLYQLAYMVGGLQFYALKKELVDSKKMTIKQYHDAILQENALPVEMLRAILTNQNLKKDFKTQWRFYDKTKP